MTPGEFAQRMRDIYPEDDCYDPEVAHGPADDLLCEVLRELGYGEGVGTYEEAVKWYS